MSKAILKKNKIYGGLQPTPEDVRDFPLGALYTLPKLEEIPDEFVVAEPVAIKDQGDSDMCTAYAGTAASEAQEKVEFSPEYQFMKTKQISGSPEAWGANLRDMLKSLVKYGSLPAIAVPAHLTYPNAAREEIVNSKNWPKAADEQAYLYRKGSFFKVTGPYDLFDNIRATLWASRKEFERTGNPSDLKVVVTGAIWKHGWTIAPLAVIDDREYHGDGFGHAFIFDGVRMGPVQEGVALESSPLLRARLSNGRGIGDGGFYYFTREAVNKEMPPFGAYTLRDIAPENAQYLIEKGWSADLSWVAAVVLFFKKLFSPR